MIDGILYLFDIYHAETEAKKTINEIRESKIRIYCRAA